MRCFYVLIHGRLRWRKAPSINDNSSGDRPAGFYCHRYVLASGEQAAIQKAIRSVTNNLDKRTGWFRNRAADLIAEADEVEVAPLIKGFLPDNQGATFYEAE